MPRGLVFDNIAPRNIVFCCAMSAINPDNNKVSCLTATTSAATIKRIVNKKSRGNFIIFRGGPSCDNFRLVYFVLNIS